MIRIFSLLLAALTVPLAPSGAEAAATQQRPDWSRVVAATPQGGFRMGNPNARVKLVEYGSLTCPHCRHFAETSGTALVKNYVRTGKVSYEFRNMVLNGLDAAATLTARCGGARSFFPTVADLYAMQPTWIAKATGLTNEQKKQIDALPEGQRLGALAQLAGVVQIGAKHGIAPTAAKRCLSDTAALERLAKMYQAAMGLGVQGTPTFFVNGKIANVDDWADLEPLLKKAGG
jgi:protein-disulfide isomerase